MLEYKFFDQYFIHQITLKQTIDLLCAKEAQISSKKILNSLHITSIKFGFELQYVNEKLHTIFLYFHPQSQQRQFKPYPFTLPFSLYYKSSMKSVKNMLGQPTKKNVVEYIYDNLGIAVVFKGKNDDSPIDYLYLFEPENAMIDLCNCCLKEKKSVQFFCKNCKWVGFCSEKCRNLLLFDHKIMCQEID